MKVELISDTMNLVSRKMAEATVERTARGLSTSLDDLIATVRGEVERLSLEQLEEVATFCIAVCATVGPRRLNAMIKQGIQEK